MNMRPDLIRTVVLATLAKVPDNVKQRLVSTLPVRREHAEDVIAASIGGALTQCR